jgi:hypothetical protein
MPDATAPPRMRFASAESTEVPATTVHTDGTTTAGTARIVHEPGAPVPAQVQHDCGPRCGCRTC